MIFRLQRLCLAALAALAACAVLAGCAGDVPRFVPPAERAVASIDQPWPANAVLGIAYHDVEDEAPDQAYLSVRTDKLVAQLAWLRENGYQAVSVDQILAAHAGRAQLPERAVLLSFDDGYGSFYRRVYPILKAYGWPAVLAPVGTWVDERAPGEPVDFGGLPTPRERFAAWPEIAEMAASGLIEIGAHTDNLHFGVPANPQGNTQPAVTTRIWNAATRSYESEAAYERRLSVDAQRITDKIRAATGRAPRVWVWPYGAVSGTMLRILDEQGYPITLTLEDGLGRAGELRTMPRLLVSNDPGPRSFARAVVGAEAQVPMRVLHVDLDYVYDPDPVQRERNLGELVQRVADMQVSAVFLQAYADPEGDGRVRELYFPNRWLPMRADLFNRAAWQLTTRAFVEVYAWMPVLGFELDPALPRVLAWDPATGATVQAPGQYRRLSPFDPEVRRRIGDIYEDLGRSTPFFGLLFHDDALLSDYEDAGPAAMAAYRAAGLPDSLEALRGDPDTLRRWTRFKTRYLIDFTHELAARARAARGPDLKLARNIYALPVVEPDSEAWFAQNLDDFLAAYDWTAPMAMPLMENVPPARIDAWLDGLVDAVAARPGALERTVFEVQAVDWRRGARQAGRAVDTERLAAWLERLQVRGARSFGYYPDDFLRDQPRLEAIRPVISNAWYPYP